MPWTLYVAKKKAKLHSDITCFQKVYQRQNADFQYFMLLSPEVALCCSSGRASNRLYVFRVFLAEISRNVVTVQNVQCEGLMFSKRL